MKGFQRSDCRLTRKRLRRTIRKLDEDIYRFLDEMDQTDEAESTEKGGDASHVRRQNEDSNRQNKRNDHRIAAQTDVKLGDLSLSVGFKHLQPFPLIIVRKE